MRLKLLLIAFSISIQLSSQVRIDDQNIAPTIPVNSSAILELISNNRGIIIPRLSLTSTLLPNPLAGHIAGTLVYNTATSGMSPNNVTPGLYYNDGSKWIKSNFIPNNTYWSLAGNSSTSPSSSSLGSSLNGDFLGSIDNKDLILGTNNLERVRITSEGKLGINSQSPFSLFNPIYGVLATRLSNLVSNGLLSTNLLNGTATNLHLSNVLNTNILGDVGSISNTQHSAIAQLNVVDAPHVRLNIGSFNDVRGPGSAIGSYSFAKNSCSSTFNLFNNFLGNFNVVASYNETETNTGKSIGVVGRSRIVPPFCVDYPNIGGLFEGLVLDSNKVIGSQNYGVVGRAQGSIIGQNFAVYGSVLPCNNNSNAIDNFSGLFENGFFHVKQSPIGINTSQPKAWLTFGSVNRICNSTVLPLMHFSEKYTNLGLPDNSGVHFIDGGMSEVQHFMSDSAHISFNSGGKVQTIGSNEIMRIVARSKNVGIGTVNPNKRLEIKDGVIGNSGLRFTDLTSSFNPSISSTKFLTVNPNGDVILANAQSGGVQSYILPSNISSTSLIRSNISGWTIPVLAGKSYKIEIIGTYQSAATTTGGSIGLVTVGAAGSIHGLFEMEISQSTSAAGLKTTLRAISASSTLAGSFITSTGVGAINSPHSIWLTSVFNCTTAGTVNIQWGSEVNASASQLNSGSVLIVTVLN